MTAFNDNTSGKTIEPEKPAEQDVIPTSRIKSDAKLWEQAGEVSDMLSFCRPHNSKVERKFIAKFIVPLSVRFDKKGNAYKQVGDNPTILWSSHTDTVHTVQGFQKIQYWHDKKTGDVNFEVAHGKLPWGKQSACLGADDTVGVWLMIQMIRAGVPGLYIFHRGEECGGIGSKWIAENNKEALKGIKYAIAFDRRGEKSIITYQRSTRCCSDEFAKSLAEQLGMGHECDDTGSFTDTASYVDLIAECSNLSVGYQSAHMRSEYTNIDYLFRLRDALLKIDITKLVEKRKPGENDRKPYVYSGGAYGDFEGYWGNHYWNKPKNPNHKKEDGKSGVDLRKEHGGNSGWMDEYEWDPDFCLWFPKTKAKKSTNISYAEACNLVRRNPAAIVDLLEHTGYDKNAIKDWLIEAGCEGNTIIM